MSDKKEKWRKRFINLAKYIADEWSEDPSTKVGAVIVNDRNDILSTGYNGFARGVKNTLSRNEKPIKFVYYEHAERNAIYNAANEGVRLQGSTIYISTLFCCDDCARAIIQSGIKKVVAPEYDLNHKKYGPIFKYSYEMLKEANIEIDTY